MNLEIPDLFPFELEPDYYNVKMIKRGSMNDVKSRIESTLRKLGFTYKYDYSIIVNLFNCHVVINRDLIINDPRIERLPFKINRVKGNCDITGGNLSTLTSTPNVVDGYFNVSGNNLTSLAYFPREVGGGIYINNNQIKKFTDTKGNSYFPDHLKGDFNCSSNKLGSLKGGPSIVDGRYDCSGNKLKNLDYAPTTHPRIFNCSGNPIEDFSSTPNGSLVYSNPHEIPDNIISSKNLNPQSTKVIIEPPDIEHEAHTEEELEKGYHDED